MSNRKKLVKAVANAIYIIYVDNSIDETTKKDRIKGVIDVVKHNKNLSDADKKSLLNDVATEIANASDGDIAVIDWLVNTADGAKYVSERMNR